MTNAYRRIPTIFVAVGLLVCVFGFLASDNAEASNGCHISVSGQVAQAVDCPQGSHIATYKYPDGVSPSAPFAQTLPQALFDSGTSQADVPGCAFQADVFYGDTLQTIDEAHLYGDRLVVAVHGGEAECSQPTTTTTAPTSTTATTTPASSTTTPSSTATTRPSTSTTVNIGTATSIVQTPTTVTSVEGLPRTGSNNGFLLLIGVLLVCVGAGLWFVGRSGARV